ncbi:MAG: transcription antitermination factor NusB [Bacteroidota bacterium]
MLNRRTLRIKAMQSIYAYEQCKEANYHLALNNIEETFQPDLNSMEKQDKVLLKAQSKEATDLFKESFKAEEAKKLEASEECIVEEVKKATDYYHDQIKKDAQFLKREMLKDAELIYKRYLWLIHWAGAFIDLLSDTKPRKGFPSFNNLLNNTAIKHVLSNKELTSLYAKNDLTWDNQEEEFRVWLYEVFMKDEFIVDYLYKGSTNFNSDKEVLLHIYRSIFFKNEIISSYMEKTDLYWAENKAILRSMVLKTLKAIEEDIQDFELAALSYNWEEDKQFFETIYNQTIKEGEFYDDLIAGKTKNWDIDRISDTDRILLQMAIQEMINFPGIPVKVTINEYIEVSKKYSTPKSKQFINGVLDVIAVDLQNKGVIKKSGRGLIDNK